MTWFLTGPFVYAAVALLAVGTVCRVVAILRMPPHLRWELYPLPGLRPAGSGHQQNSPERRRHRLAEFRFMAEEILLLRKVFAQRRSLWVGSWLMHAGLYLGTCFLAMLLAGAAMTLLGLSPDAGRWPVARGFRALTALTGSVAMIAGLTGAVWLLVLRVTDRGLRAMSDTVSYFHLGLLAAMFAAGLAVWSADAGFAECRQHLASLLRLQPGTVQSLPLTVAIALAAVFAAIFPFGRLFHPVAKYFFYHTILWDDGPITRGSTKEHEILDCLSERVTWSAGHVVPQGTWLEQAQSPGSGKAPAP
jgi:nitrate reductase gamma subunit